MENMNGPPPRPRPQLAIQPLSRGPPLNLRAPLPLTSPFAQATGCDSRHLYTPTTFRAPRPPLHPEGLLVGVRKTLTCPR